MANKDRRVNEAEQTKASAIETGDAKVVKTEAPKKTSGDGGAASVVVAAIIILLLLAGVGFLIFGLVQSLNNNKPTDGTQTTDSDKDNNDNQNDDKADDDKSNDNGNDNDDNDGKGDPDKGASDDEGDDASDDEGDGDDKDDNDGKSSGGKTSGKTMDKIAMSAAYAAKYPATNTIYRRGNDYAFGDIGGSTYIVKKGDTLWQIAEARYGSGFAWVEIDRANGGFPPLPNGQPVLLPIGYKLTLPDLESR